MRTLSKLCEQRIKKVDIIEYKSITEVTDRNSCDVVRSSAEYSSGACGTAQSTQLLKVLSNIFNTELSVSVSSFISESYCVHLIYTMLLEVCVYRAVC